MISDYKYKYNLRRAWKLPTYFPNDPETKLAREEMFKENGNGWWWYRNTSDRIKATSTPSQRNEGKKHYLKVGGSLKNNGGRRGL